MPAAATPIERFRVGLRRLFYGHRPAAVRFQIGLLALDLAAVALVDVVLATPEPPRRASASRSAPGRPKARCRRGMRDLGHGAADRWLGGHLAHVGVRSTVDLAAFAGPVLDPPGLDGRRSVAA